MKAKKSQKALESLKTLAICLLFLCAIALSALYFYRSGFIFSKGSIGSGSTEVDPDSEIVSNQFDGLVLPESIAVKFSGKHTFAITQGDGYMSLIYRLVCRNVSVALSLDCTAEEAEEAAWLEACSADEFILVKYHAPLSHSVIYADSVSNAGEAALLNGLETDIGAVDQMFIFPGKTEKGNVFAVTRGRNGEIFNLILNTTVADSSCLKSEDFDLYISASAMTLADLYCHVSSKSNILYSTILHSYGLNSQKISHSHGYAEIVEDTTLCNTIASFFDINPDKSGNYYDEKTKSSVFVATHGSLHIGEETISYVSSGDTGGISLSNYSDAFSENGIDVTQAIILTQSFISGYRNLDRRFLGGDAHPVLSAVYSSTNGRVILEYIYCYSNVEIQDAPIACRLTLKDGKIMGFESSNHMYNISDGGERRQSLLPEWIINMSAEDDNGLYSLKYRYSTSDMLAEWTLVKIK